jgi:hypothetical protein
MLKDLGWYNEDDEIRPLLIYLPIYKNQEKDILNVRENCILEIIYFGVNKTGKFRITAKRLDSLYGNYWVCKCVPERIESFIDNYSDGFHYLSVDKILTVVDTNKTTVEKSEPSFLSNDSSTLIDTMSEFGFQNYDSGTSNSQISVASEHTTTELGSISDLGIMGLSDKDDALVNSSSLNELPAQDTIIMNSNINNLEAEIPINDSASLSSNIDNVTSESTQQDSGVSSEDPSKTLSESVQQDNGVVTSEPSTSTAETIKIDTLGSDDYSSLVME